MTIMSPTPSPCIQVCHLDDATGLCAGCLRTISEITLWSSLDEAGRRAVIAAVAVRKQRLAQRGD